MHPCRTSRERRESTFPWRVERFDRHAMQPQKPGNGQATEVFCWTDLGVRDGQGKAEFDRLFAQMSHLPLDEHRTHKAGLDQPH
jgi:hypothetical protein